MYTYNTCCHLWPLSAIQCLALRRSAIIYPVLGQTFNVPQSTTMDFINTGIATNVATLLTNNFPPLSQYGPPLCDMTTFIHIMNRSCQTLFLLFMYFMAITRFSHGLVVF